MEGNKTKIIAVNGDNGPERTGDTYGIEGVAFPGFHVPDLLQVEPRGSSNLIKINLGQGPNDCPVDCFFLSKSKKYFTDRQDSQKIIDFDREMKSVIGNEDPYVDVLQNIEAIISKICTAQGDCDQDVVVAKEMNYLQTCWKCCPTNYPTCGKVNRSISTGNCYEFFLNWREWSFSLYVRWKEDKTTICGK